MQQPNPRSCERIERLATRWPLLGLSAPSPSILQSSLVGHPAGRGRGSCECGRRDAHALVKLAKQAEQATDPRELREIALASLRSLRGVQRADLRFTSAGEGGCACGSGEVRGLRGSVVAAVRRSAPGLVTRSLMLRSGQGFIVLAAEADAWKTLAAVVRQAAVVIDLVLSRLQLAAQQSRLMLGSLRTLCNAIDAKDSSTAGHSERVANLASSLGRAYGVDQGTCDALFVCGLVHDIGKIAVPESVLTKPSRLDQSEQELVRQHPEAGYAILKDLPQLGDVLLGVLHHHERWDGTGYPHRQAGEQIPLIARVMAVADSFDAMSTSRAYRPSMAREQVLAELTECSGTQFDPQLVEAFLGLDLAEYDVMVSHQGAVACAPRFKLVG